MAVAVKTSGSHTPVGNTEETLATVTDAGVYTVAVDLAAMTNGATPDLTIVRIYGKARSTDTERLIMTSSFIGAQSVALWLSPPIHSPHHLKLTLEQDQGTLRAYPWAIYNT